MKAPAELVAELKLQYVIENSLGSNTNETPTDALSSIKSCSSDAFPNMFALLGIQ